MAHRGHTHTVLQIRTWRSPTRKQKNHKAISIIVHVKQANLSGSKSIGLTALDLDFISEPGVGLAGLTRGDALQRKGRLQGVGLSAGPGPVPSGETAIPSSLLAQESTPEV